MKVITSISLLILFSSNLWAQNINLPSYQSGQYENDTIYTYFGTLPFSGIGSINLGGTLLSSNFISGVEFILVIDSTNQGMSPTHSAFEDSSGVLIPIYAGDSLSIPANIQLFAGEIGFHVVLEGTPFIASESYLCDLGYTFSTGSNWNMIILENTSDSCLVGPSVGIDKDINRIQIQIGPNPFQEFTLIRFDNQRNERYDFELYDFTGKKVQEINNVRSNCIELNRNNLPTGVYLFQLQNKIGRVYSGRLIMN